MKADFSKIIRDAIQITKTNKKLWVLGLVLAAFGSSFNANSFMRLSDIGKKNEKPKSYDETQYQLPNNLPAEFEDRQLLNSNLLGANASQVLGTATTSLTSLTDLIRTIPVSFYGLAGILILVSIIVGVGVSLYAQSWARSGLIQGINRQSSGETLTLYQMADHGKLKALEVIKIGIFPGIVFALAICVSTLILIILGLLVGDSGRILITIIGVLYAIAVIIASIILSASINLGILAINLESLKWLEGFKRGFYVFKKHFIDVAILSVINCLAGCVLGLVIILGMAVFGGIGAAAFFGAMAFPPFLVAAGPLIFLAVLAFIMLAGLTGAIATVFKQSTWVLLYKQLTEGTNGQ
ncbi:MAG: hypothetical protein ABIH84_01695 [bacterium]